MGKKKLYGEYSSSQIILLKVYGKPELILLGDIRAFTLGPSVGTGESGAPTTRHGSGPTGSIGERIVRDQVPGQNPFDIQP
jgi:hypothetical protein